MKILALKYLPASGNNDSQCRHGVQHDFFQCVFHVENPRLGLVNASCEPDRVMYVPSPSPVR